MTFFDKILSEFPNLEEEFKDAEDFEIHYKMERIASYINACIKERNEIDVFQCFDVIERYLTKGIDKNLENAINVSFCEPILLLNNTKDKIWTINLMRTRLKSIYFEYQEYYEKTFNSK